VGGLSESHRASRILRRRSDFGTRAFLFAGGETAGSFRFADTIAGTISYGFYAISGRAGAFVIKTRYVTTAGRGARGNYYPAGRH